MTCSTAYTRYYSLSDAKTACYNRGSSCAGVYQSSCSSSYYYRCNSGTIAYSYSNCVYTPASAGWCKSCGVSMHVHGANALDVSLCLNHQACALITFVTAPLLKPSKYPMIHRLVRVDKAHLQVLFHVLFKHRPLQFPVSCQNRLFQVGYKLRWRLYIRL